MKKRKIEIDVLEYGSTSELPAIEKEMVEKAVEAAQKAYAPYSNFHVGSAVLLEDDSIITGSNQENAAYPSGLCAERVALFYAGAQHPEKAVKAIAVVAMKDGELIDLPAFPCGSCRQVILETKQRTGAPMRVIMAAKNRIDVLEDALELLPLHFDKDSL